MGDMHGVLCKLNMNALVPSSYSEQVYEFMLSTIKYCPFIASYHQVVVFMMHPFIVSLGLKGVSLS